MMATTLADSSHIEVETHSDEIAHIQEHNHDENEPNNSDEHCPDHEECHNGHVHHLLLISSSLNNKIRLSNNSDFAEFYSFYVSKFPEIIKPPLLNS